LQNRDRRAFFLRSSSDCHTEISSETETGGNLQRSPNILDDLRGLLRGMGREGGEKELGRERKREAKIGRVPLRINKHFYKNAFMERIL